VVYKGKGMKETIEQAKDDMGLGASHLGTANGKMNICRYFIEELGFVPDLRFRLWNWILSTWISTIANPTLQSFQQVCTAPSFSKNTIFSVTKFSKKISTNQTIEVLHNLVHYKEHTYQDPSHQYEKAEKKQHQISLWKICRKNACLKQFMKATSPPKVPVAITTA